MSLNLHERDAAHDPSAAMDALSRYPLLDALRLRRSRRFAVGAELPASGLKFKSKQPPLPLGDSHSTPIHSPVEL
ncbi:MAG: hypothetical protein AAGB11_14050 [Pseudomonadota bacterium]